MKSIVVVLSICVLAGCGNGGSQATQSSTSNPVAPNKPTSDSRPTLESTSAIDITEAQLGLPFYPGASLIRPGTMKVSTKERNSYAYTATTTDGVQKVAQFYGPHIKVLHDTGKPTDESALIVGDVADGRHTQVMIVKRQKAADVSIHIMTVGDPK